MTDSKNPKGIVFNTSAAYDALSDYEKAAIFYSECYKDMFGCRPISCPETLEDIDAEIEMWNRHDAEDKEREEQYERDVRNARRKDDHMYKEADTRFAALLSLKKRK